MDFGSIEDETQEAQRIEQKNGDFSKLLEEYQMERPRRGQILEGEIIQIDEDHVLVDVGAKRDAVVPRTDLARLDEGKLESLSSGDSVPVYVLRTPVGDEDLIVSINKGLTHEDWLRAQESLESGEVHELEILEQNRGGLLVAFGRLRGFIPNSHVPELRRLGSRQQIDDRKMEMIGETLLLKVIEVDANRRRLILSAREAREERRQKRMEELEIGQIIKGHVVNLVDFGAFVNLGGIDGLLHKSEMDWRRVDDPAEVLSKGDEVEVLIKDIDLERERISLSRKALVPNPWQEVAERYQEGDLLEGTVTNVQDYGAFVQIPERVEGLIHVSEMNLVDVGSPREVLRAGDKVLVRVIEINSEEGRMGLSLRRVTQEEQLTWIADDLETDQEEPDQEETPQAETEPEAEALDEPMPEAGEDSQPVDADFSDPEAFDEGAPLDDAPLDAQEAESEALPEGAEGDPQALDEAHTEALAEPDALEGDLQE